MVTLMPNDHWRTPDSLFEFWDGKYQFILDAAANAYDAKCQVYIDPNLDALTTEWTDITYDVPGNAWCNPPYSKHAGPLRSWVERFIYMSKQGWTVVSLLPADTSTKWWGLVWDYKKSKWKDNVEGHFLTSRVRHELPEVNEPGYDPKNTEGSPRWGSAIIIFHRG